MPVEKKIKLRFDFLRGSVLKLTGRRQSRTRAGCPPSGHTQHTIRPLNINTDALRMSSEPHGATQRHTH